MKRERVAPGDWKRQDWKQVQPTEKEKRSVARGKHSSAALHRRYEEAAEDARHWKKQSGIQAREIRELTAEVNLMPAMKERVASLEMQLSLATCQEIESLTATVSAQREELADLRETATGIAKRYSNLIRGVGSREQQETASEWMCRLDVLVNGDEASLGLNGLVMEDPTAPRHVNKKLGAHGVRVIERARQR